MKRIRPVRLIGPVEPTGRDKPPCASLSRNHGFTLIEIALSALVIGLGILALFSLARVAVQSSSEAEDEVRTALFAENVFASLRAASAELQRSGDTNAWPRFWSEFSAGETNLLDAAWNMWQQPDDEEDLKHRFGIWGDGNQHTNHYLSDAPGRDGSVSGIPEYRVMYRLDVKLTNAVPSLGEIPSRAELNLIVWNMRTPGGRAYTFYTHLVNHGKLP